MVCLNAKPMECVQQVVCKALSAGIGTVALAQLHRAYACNSRLPADFWVSPMHAWGGLHMGDVHACAGGGGSCAHELG